MSFSRRFSFVCLLLLGIGIVFLNLPFFVKAVDCDSEESCAIEIEKLKKDLEASTNATTPLEKQVENFEARIDSARLGIAKAKKQAEDLASDIKKREADLVHHYKIFSNRVAESYKRARTSNQLSFLLSSQNASQLTKELAYQESAKAQDDRLIRSISEEISKLNEDKKKLEHDQERLAVLSKQLDEQADFLKGEIAKAKNYQKDLSGKIAELSAKQQSILAEKSAAFQISVGDVPMADDPSSRPNYNPGFSPAFAVFSFGAPHFKGMSQYGAFGRAKSGQNYETILKAYYGNGIEIKDHDNVTIHVLGCSSGSYDSKTCIEKGYKWIDENVDVETYANRIYELPDGWGDEGGMEALKAQAIAARSYALARGGEICPSENCQVYKSSNKGGNWEKAVGETKGKVVYVNGRPFSTWYASTSGGYQESYSSNGYSTPGFWDTASGRDGWTSQAYEKIAGSPWFYKAWYKTRSGDSCGRNHPWLTSEEMADILNAWVVMYKGGGDSGRVTPESSCFDGNPYSKNELANIGGYTGVSGVSVSYSDSGMTAEVTFQTNKGELKIKGNEFYKVFNLRAPARISVKSGLFNIEKK